MKTKLLLLLISALITINVHSQGLNQKLDKSKPVANVTIKATNQDPFDPFSMPDRSKTKLASVDLWKPLPQFQVKAMPSSLWYALENRDNATYWQGAKLNRIFICLKQGVPESELASLIASYSLQTTKSKSMFPDVMNFFVYEIPNSSKEKMLEIIEAAKTYDFILFAEPDMILTGNVCIPNDTYYASNQWGPYNVWADSAWCYTIGANSLAIVAIIDNAVDYNHPDLQNTVWYGYDYGDYDNDPIPINSSVAHGTHVSGISSAKINNSTGIAGMSNDTVYFAKVTTDANPGPYDYAACVNAINYMASEPRIRVVNMSFGGPTIDAGLQTACNNAWSNGKLLIASAGNDAQNGNPINYPAAFSTVVAVGSVDANNNWSTFSDYGNYVEVCAPGGNSSGGSGDILSTMPGGTYNYMAGTSMSAPLVTGLAGLMFSAAPSLTNSQARTILQQCVFDLGTSGWDQYYGYGEVCAYCNVIRAMQVATVAENTPNTMYWNVFPNPSNGKFTLLLEKIQSNSSVYITNSLGQEIHRSTINQLDNTSIDLTGNPNGIYFIQINTDKGSFTKKLIISKS